MTVKDLEARTLLLITDTREVQELNEEYDQDFEAYLVQVGDGELTEVYGLDYSIPYDEDKVTIVKEGK